MDSPLFSIITPVYDPPVDVLAETIRSVLAQDHADWELVVVDDGSTDPEVRRTLCAFAEADERIRLVEREHNGHIVVASNEGVALARGEFIGLLDHDDLLAPDALSRVAEVTSAYDDVDYIYSDEDKVDAEGRHFGRFRKPDWSPERQRGQNYCCHFSVLRSSVVREVGGFREGFEGSQDHDLILRVCEVARRIEHVPEVLYHWRVVPGSAAGSSDAKPYAAYAGQRAVQDHLGRVGIAAEVSLGAAPGTYRIRRQLDPAARVSLVVPTVGTADVIWGERRVLVVEAVRSLLANADHDNLEVIVVYDEPTPAEVLAELREIGGDRLVLVEYDRPFNFSEKSNLGALRSTGDYLVFANDDLQAITPGWVAQLVGPLLEPDVGLTGAKLYFDDDTIQHAGHAYSTKNYKHPYAREAREANGRFGALVINREVMGVTGACAAIRREVFLEVGGFCELLPSNFNDVDLCYKLRSRGYRIVWVAGAEMYHFQSRTRERVVEAWEKDLTVARWGMPRVDPFMPDA